MRNLSRAAVVLTVALLVVLTLIWSPWSGRVRKAAPGTPRRYETTFGADWTAPDGQRYRVTVTPSTHSVRTGSAGGCLPAALAGQVNVPFTVRIDNLGHQTAPVPVVEVGANIGPLGTVQAAALTLDRTSRRIELSPRGAGEDCAAAAGTGPVGRGTLAAGAGQTFAGMIGGVVPGEGGNAVGLTLVVRYHAQDASAAGGESADEFLVPFALAR